MPWSKSEFKGIKYHNLYHNNTDLAMSVTGKADETLLIKAIASRRGKLSVLTRKKNEINALLELGESNENVRKHAEVFNKYVEEFIESHNTVQNIEFMSRLFFV